MKSFVFLTGILLSSYAEDVTPATIDASLNDQNVCILVDIVNATMDVDKSATEYQKYIFTFCKTDQTVFKDIIQMSDQNIEAFFVYNITSKKFITGYISLLYQIFHNKIIIDINKKDSKVLLKARQRRTYLLDILNEYRKNIPNEYKQIEKELFVILSLKALIDNVARRLSDY